MTMMRAYDEFCLRGNNKLTELMFYLFAKDETYDAFSLIDSYMQHSEIRKLMDEGNEDALYKGSKQIYNSINKEICISDASKNASYNVDIMCWMGFVYSTIQWMSCLYSKDICIAIPPKKLYNSYETYKEMTIIETCEKLYKEYLQDKDFILAVIEERELERE